MKEKLKWYHSALREIACTFIGHNIKSSHRWSDDRSELMKLDYNSIPYARRQNGNCYMTRSVGWNERCRRCRMIARDAHIRDFFPIAIFKLFVQSIKGTKWRVNYILDADYYSNWKYPLIPILMMSEFLEQFFIGGWLLDLFWWWPSEIMLYFQHHIHNKLFIDTTI